ncbi:MAG: thiopurine S-methyltransferase [Luteimonas sp.]|nr:thiopurine S-methyltransferase [Luteimonas sp.]
MDAAFWHQRWQEGRIGFHRSEVMPLLERHWPSLDLPAGSRVLVPLAGKTLDMAWLAAQGHRVLGVELSQLAVEQFFAEHALQPEIEDTCHGRHYRAGDIEMICGDAFALDRELLADCVGVYDRAALIALPTELRQRYVGTIYARLPAGCRGLLITLEYPQHEKDGPPFSVDETEVRRLLEPDWEVGLIERRDILAQESSFQADGVTALRTAVYRLEKRD